MKKLLMIIAMVVLVLQVGAAPARRSLRQVSQPDGTLLTIMQHGDEYHHWTSTTDGTLVVQTKKGCFVAQINDEGRLCATDVLAHEVGQRSERELAVTQEQTNRRALFHERGEQAARRAMSISTSGNYLPHTGSPRVLTILAQYQDVHFTVNHPMQAFEQFLNGDSQQDLGNHNTINQASIRQYFDHCSYGQFTPQFDLVGPVTLPHEMSYYGGSDSNGNDERFTEFCQHTIDQVKEQQLVSDWSRYDNDGDGRIELVCIIYAGYGQNQDGANETMWAKASKENMTIEGNYKVSFFNCCCELNDPDPTRKDWINGIGPFIHEFSHCMGLPDIYATTSSAQINNQSMESWDVMDYGLYCGANVYDGSAPAPYLAWEREVMGWSTMEVLEHSQQALCLYPMTNLEQGKAYRIPNADNDNEYIVLENIQQEGLNKYAYGHGLLVYHVAYPSTKVNMTDSPNNWKGHPGVSTVPAGGLLISSYQRGTGKTYTRAQWLESIAASTFPGTKNITSLNSDMQLPNYLFYKDSSNTTAVGFSLDTISEDATTGCITLNVVNEREPAGISEWPTADPKGPQVWYTLDGRKLTGCPAQKGLYIHNGHVVNRNFPTTK